MNNNYDEIDNLLFEYFENNQDVPDLIVNGINCAIQNKNKQYKIITLIKKAIITIISLLTITGGVVFAKDIKIFVENLIENIFCSYNNGISTAVENGYIEEPDTEYSISNNTKVKIEKITMDNYNLGIIFNIELGKTEDLDNLFNVQLKNMLILDENNNVIYSEYENQNDFIEYCKQNQLDSGTYGTGYANSGANGQITSKENNKIVYSMYTTSENFPNSSKLNIKFNKIYLLNNKVFDEITNQPVDNHYDTIEGSWEINLDLDNLKNNRNEIDYEVTNINDNNTTVTEAHLSMTNMRLELITNSNKIDFKKLKARNNINVSTLEMKPFHDIYIETSDGKKYYQTSSGGNGYNEIENEKIEFYSTFDYTYFDKAENIKIVLPTNKNKDLIIELKAK